MSRNIHALYLLASSDSNGIIFDCKYECQPSAPKPNARCLLAKLYARSINSNAFLSSVLSESRNSSSFVLHSVITASKKNIIVSTASVSFHSSYCNRFIDERLQPQDSSLLFGKVISEHTFE